MAKKKKSKNEPQLFNLTAIIFGIAAICMIFVTAVKYTGKFLGSVNSLAGTAVVFGNDEALSFSFMALLPYILTLAGIALLVLKAFKIIDLELIAFAAFVAAAVFFFLTPSFVVTVSDEVFGAIGDFSLGIGSILAGVFSAFAAVTLACKKIMK